MAELYAVIVGCAGIVGVIWLSYDAGREDGRAGR